MIIQQFPGLSQRSVYVGTLALCLCVIVQMLGASVTRLSAEDMPDEFSGSVLEGLPLPQVHLPLTLPCESIPAVDSPACAGSHGCEAVEECAARFGEVSPKLTKGPRLSSRGAPLLSACLLVLTSERFHPYAHECIASQSVSLDY